MFILFREDIALDYREYMRGKIAGLNVTSPNVKCVHYQLTGPHSAKWKLIDYCSMVHTCWVCCSAFNHYQTNREPTILFGVFVYYHFKKKRTLNNNTIHANNDANSVCLAKWRAHTNDWNGTTAVSIWSRRKISKTFKKGIQPFCSNLLKKVVCFYLLVRCCQLLISTTTELPQWMAV